MMSKPEQLMLSVVSRRDSKPTLCSAIRTCRRWFMCFAVCVCVCLFIEEVFIGLVTVMYASFYFFNLCASLEVCACVCWGVRVCVCTFWSILLLLAGWTLPVACNADSSLASTPILLVWVAGQMLLAANLSPMGAKLQGNRFHPQTGLDLQQSQRNLFFPHWL